MPRRKKTAQEHQLTGTRPAYDELRPRPAPTPRCPAHLPDEGQRLWRKLAPALAERGLLDNKLDGPALEQLCMNYAMAREAQRDIATNGLFTQAASGWRQASPAVSVFNRATGQMLKWASVFGLSPQGRQSLGVASGPPENERSLADELMDLVRGQ